MANIHKNVFIHGLKDLLGNRSAYCKTCSGKTILVANASSDDNLKFAQIQKKDPAAMREATMYADFAKTQDAYLHRERTTGVSAYYIAVMDWFEAPSVLEINVDSWSGKPEQTLHIKARDNIGVTTVTVVIRDTQDNVLEAGEAVQVKAGSPWWKYTTRAYVNIEPFPIVEATAWDLAGNQDSFAIT